MFLCGVAVTTLSAAADEPAETVPATAVAPVSDLDKIVCHYMAPAVGSRLVRRKVCATQRQWDSLRADSQKIVSDGQTHTFTTSQGQYTGGGY